MTPVHLPATESGQPTGAPAMPTERKALPTVATSVTTTMRIAPDLALSVMAPVDLSRIFRGYGPLPAVVAVDNQSGTWDTPGATRTPRL